MARTISIMGFRVKNVESFKKDLIMLGMYFSVDAKLEVDNSKERVVRLTLENTRVPGELFNFGTEGPRKINFYEMLQSHLETDSVARLFQHGFDELSCVIIGKNFSRVYPLVELIREKVEDLKEAYKK